MVINPTHIGARPGFVVKFLYPREGPRILKRGKLVTEGLGTRDKTRAKAQSLHNYARPRLTGKTQ